MKPKFNQSKIKLAVVSAIVAGSMGLSATSYAATTTATMTVSTTVANSCSISVGAMDFGAYDQTARRILLLLPCNVDLHSGRSDHHYN